MSVEKSLAGQNERWGFVGPVPVDGRERVADGAAEILDDISDGSSPVQEHLTQR